ncbi:hypothetical protein ES703_10829 [subsurface metagenome]
MLSRCWKLAVASSIVFLFLLPERSIGSNALLKKDYPSLAMI